MTIAVIGLFLIGVVLAALVTLLLGLKRILFDVALAFVLIVLTVLVT